MWTWLRTLPRLLSLHGSLFFFADEPTVYAADNTLYYTYRDHPARGGDKHEDHMLVVTTLGVVQNYYNSLK